MFHYMTDFLKRLVSHQCATPIPVSLLLCTVPPQVTSKDSIFRLPCSLLLVEFVYCKATTGNYRVAEEKV